LSTGGCIGGHPRRTSQEPRSGYMPLAATR
jgi:hypothetical protein